MTGSGAAVIDCETPKTDSRSRVQEVLECVFVHLATHSKEDQELFVRTFVTAVSASDKREKHEAAKLLTEILCENGPTRSSLWRWTLDAVEEEGKARDPKLLAWMEHVAAKIKALRLEKGWTQDDLAEHTGLSQSHVSRIEQCYHAPSHKTLTKIAKELGVSVGDIDPTV